MDELFQRIADAASKDVAVSDEQMYLYLAEEVGEVATCLAVENGMKGRLLDEPMDSELCDVLISTLGMLARRGKDMNYIRTVMAKKIPKWERRVANKSQGIPE